ncbi:FLJ37770-like protein [Acromyrmex echinatior]|uniref:FLJ37770-like protein n=1 Tax=Acromyrmex echinatior TaxID=103372 RepID=F4WVN1_ACREC|nr:FLJ37770-like protein [Acromyrmex echinatior]
MNFEQRANIKFCFKLGKTFTETHNLMKQVYGDNCVAHASVYEWYTRFKNGREDINDDAHTGRPKSTINENSIEVVRNFIKHEPKSSVRYMEMELNIPKSTIYRILTEHLGLQKVCARFVPHNWRLLHDNAPSHRSTLVTDFLTKNHILTINHSPYSPDMAPCDFYLFGKMHLSMKGKRYVDVEDIQRACTTILKDVPLNDIKHSFEMLLDRAKRCIESDGDYFE